MLLKEKNYVVTLTDPEIKTIADSLQNDCVSMRSRIEELLLKKGSIKGREPTAFYTRIASLLFQNIFFLRNLVPLLWN